MEELKADFVACCSGRRFPILKWLQQLGCHDVPVETLSYYAGYMGALFRPSAEQEAALGNVNGCAWIPHHRERLIGCSGISQENGLHMITIWGYGKDQPPPEASKNPEAMYTWVDGLDKRWAPEMKRRMQTWEQVTTWRRYLDPVMSFRHFEKIRAEDWPDRLVVLGDAVCSFNPTFGQGMTHAIQCAEILNDMFEKITHSPQLVCLDGLAHEFQKAQSKISAHYWNGNKPEDICRPSTKEKPSLGDRLMHKFSYHLLKQLSLQKKINLLYQVSGGTKPPTAFFHPSILIPALISWGKELFGKSESAPVKKAE